MGREREAEERGHWGEGGRGWEIGGEASYNVEAAP